MTIKQFIEKAIEGGWKSGKHVSIQKYVMGRLPTVSVGEPSDPSEFLRAQNYLLDPEAWKAVGKVEGWESEKRTSTGLVQSAEYVARMHDMIDALAEGKTIEQYFETL